ncbi:MAG: hypothetical protein KAT32_02665 [Candidatus Moranbacteria bacterium]|nr:hypothetical protein [Candidatus Moranbacteria bacterium]
MFNGEKPVRRACLLSADKHGRQALFLNNFKIKSHKQKTTLSGSFQKETI